MMTWRDYLVEDDRRRGMLDEARRQRHSRGIDRRPSRLAGWYRVAIVRLGAWMETMGRRMQASDGSEAYTDVRFTPAATKLIEGC